MVELKKNYKFFKKEYIYNYVNIIMQFTDSNI